MQSLNRRELLVGAGKRFNRATAFGSIRLAGIWFSPGQLASEIVYPASGEAERITNPADRSPWRVVAGSRTAPYGIDRPKASVRGAFDEFAVRISDRSE